MVLRSKADSRLGRCGAILIAVSEVAVEVGIDASRQSTFGLNKITRTHESASYVATDSLNAIRGWFVATRLPQAAGTVGRGLLLTEGCVRY